MLRRKKEEKGKDDKREEIEGAWKGSEQILIKKKIKERKKVKCG